ncbi:MAG: DUF5913 domain-containing protein, partial [Atopostipes suicloacalis]|nr:DUF5913 domain-containing protein [Atopostipes suicloacalis]
RHFKEQDHEKAVNDGKRIVRDIILDYDLEPKNFMDEEIMDKHAQSYNYKDSDRLYAAIGFNEIKPITVVNKLTEDARRKQDKKSEKLSNTLITKQKTEQEKLTIHHEDGVIVDDTENLLLRLSKCCNPVPGDEIVGYITRGRGISVHRKDCPNVNQEDEIKKRLIEVEWENTKNEKIYDTDLEVNGFDRSGLLNDVLEVVNSMTSRLSNVNGRVDSEHVAVIRLSVGIHNTKELREIISKIKQIPDVYSIRRITQ